jgi:hypothetical protein
LPAFLCSGHIGHWNWHQPWLPSLLDPVSDHAYASDDRSKRILFNTTVAKTTMAIIAVSKLLK